MTINRIWKSGADSLPDGPVHVSMNDYWVHRRRDIPRVVREGLRFRRAWPTTEGALGLWIAAFSGWRRQVSVSVWRSPNDLQRFVHSEGHRHIMREFRDAGSLCTTAWATTRCDRRLIWAQAHDRLMERVHDDVASRTDARGPAREDLGGCEPEPK